MSTPARQPVRLVLFDVFDTLCTPRIPIHEQYHEEAIRAGLPADLTPDKIRDGFKPAFKELSKRYPLYGKHAEPPISPEEWWIRLIQSCMRHAGATDGDLDRVMPTLGPNLLERFESDHGYRNFPETLDCLKQLQAWGIKTSIVSNADPRILRTLSSLHILPLLSTPPTLSWDTAIAKPDPGIFRAACRSADLTVEEDVSSSRGVGVIHVGDELEADYRGAVSAGIEARLIRRQGEWSDGAVRNSNEDLEGVRTITTLSDIVDEVRRRNGLLSADCST